VINKEVSKVHICVVSMGTGAGGQRGCSPFLGKILNKLNFEAKLVVNQGCAFLLLVSSENFPLPTVWSTLTPLVSNR
jgi:hypothetical protein